MRIELIHPLLVHFPLALLTVGTFLRILAFFFRERFLFTSWVILGLGVCFIWATILAGEFAADIVEKDLCNPLILVSHSNFAYTAAYLFTATLLLDWMNDYWFHEPILFNICSFFVLVCAAILIYVGFLGSALVYEQGAAVEKRCQGKEEPAEQSVLLK
jgi:uncharacterized membrane protein